VSVEDTFEVDLADVDRIRFELDRLTARCVRRLRAAGRSGRTVVIKVRRFDFSTLTRSGTLPSPTDDPLVIGAMVRRLLAQVELVGGVRLLGVGVSGLADFTQEDLFAQAQREAEEEEELLEALAEEAEGPAEPEQEDAAYGGPEGPRAFHPGTTPETPARRWMPGQDVAHEEYGHGWVQGSGVGRVTVRFEEPGEVPGRIRTFAVDDPALVAAEPLPLLRS